MAAYYVAQGGTAADKGDATTGTYPGGCMSVAVHNGETFAAGDTIYLSDEGGDFVGTGTYVFNVPSSGSSGSPITYAAKDGDTPVIDGADDLTTAAHLWTESSTSGEFYVRTSGGGDASIVDPQAIKMGSTYVIVEGYSAGSLNDLEAAFGDNDGLGYNTLYVRDDTNGNPETSGVTILAQQRVPFRVYQKSYITIDGITARHSAPQWYGGFHVDQSGAGSNCIVQNCIAEYNSSGIEMQRGNNNVIDNNIVRYNFGLGINHKGATGVQITGSEIKNNVVHTIYQTRFTSGLEDGYGIKCYWWNGGSVHNNEVYGCEFQGVDLDGDCLRGWRRGSGARRDGGKYDVGIRGLFGCQLRFDARLDGPFVGHDERNVSRAPDLAGCHRVSIGVRAFALLPCRRQTHLAERAADRHDPAVFTFVDEVDLIRLAKLLSGAVDGDGLRGNARGGGHQQSDRKRTPSLPVEPHDLSHCPLGQVAPWHLFGSFRSTSKYGRRTEPAGASWLPA